MLGLTVACSPRRRMSSNDSDRLKGNGPVASFLVSRNGAGDVELEGGIGGFADLTESFMGLQLVEEVVNSIAADEERSEDEIGVLPSLRGEGGGRFVQLTLFANGEGVSTFLSTEGGVLVTPLFVFSINSNLVVEVDFEGDNGGLIGSSRICRRRA